MEIRFIALYFLRNGDLSWVESVRSCHDLGWFVLDDLGGLGKKQKGSSGGKQKKEPPLTKGIPGKQM
jgi:hypothetical protein